MIATQRAKLEQEQRHTNSAILFLDIFGPKINYLLVLTTALQVIVLALSVNGDEFRVFATELNCPVDDYNIERIMGTEDGRIFMHQKEGNVFEFHYKVDAYE